MPDGTIQDSRNPTSPQFGYLEIEETDFQDYKKHASTKDPGNGKELLDKSPIPWNRYVMFINDKDVTGVLKLNRNDRVNFEMVRLEVNLDGTPANVWVAKVLEKL